MEAREETEVGEGFCALFVSSSSKPGSKLVVGTQALSLGLGQAQTQVWEKINTQEGRGERRQKEEN